MRAGFPDANIQVTEDGAAGVGGRTPSCRRGGGKPIRREPAWGKHQSGGLVAEEDTAIIKSSVDWRLWIIPHPIDMLGRSTSKGETFAAAKTGKDETVWSTLASGKPKIAGWCYRMEFREQSYGRR